mgnify:CR=1 FL=1
MEFLWQSCSTASSTQDELDPEKYTSSGTSNSFGRSCQIHLVQADRGGMFTGKIRRTDRLKPVFRLSGLDGNVLVYFRPAGFENPALQQSERLCYIKRCTESRLRQWKTTACYLLHCPSGNYIRIISRSPRVLEVISKGGRGKTQSM